MQMKATKKNKKKDKKEKNLVFAVLEEVL